MVVQVGGLDVKALLVYWRFAQPDAFHIMTVVAKL